MLMAPISRTEIAAGKVATEKLAAREQAFEIPKKIEKSYQTYFCMHQKMLWKI